MTNIGKYTVAGLLGAVLLLVLFTDVENILSGAPSGLPNLGGSAETIEVGPQANVELFAKNPQCTARVISIQSQAIMVSFFDTDNDVSSTTLSQTVGHIQSASTTEVYDSGLYGCGRVFGFAAASTTITVVEYQ